MFVLLVLTEIKFMCCFVSVVMAKVFLYFNLVYLFFQTQNICNHRQISVSISIIIIIIIIAIIIVIVIIIIIIAIVVLISLPSLSFLVYLLSAK